MEFKEITAKTVDEAITKACLEFETSSDNLEIQVVQEGTSGFLGFIGSKPAVIKVRKKVQEEEFDILKELAKEEKKEKKAPVKEEKKAEQPKPVITNKKSDNKPATKSVSKANDAKKAKTGDNNNVVLFLVMFAAAVAMIGVITGKSLRRNRR